jgi:putative endonuclease
MTLSEILRTKSNRRAIRYTAVMPWYVYIAQARTGRYYVGITTNPQERIAEHNRGEGSKFAVNQGPFVLVYSSSPFSDKSSARKREAQIKKWTQVKKGKLIKGEWK